MGINSRKIANHIHNTTQRQWLIKLIILFSDVAVMQTNSTGDLAVMILLAHGNNIHPAHGIMMASWGIKDYSNPGHNVQTRTLVKTRAQG